MTALPSPAAPPEKQRPAERLVDRILATKQKHLAADTSAFRWPGCWITPVSAAQPGWNLSDTSNGVFEKVRVSRSFNVSIEAGFLYCQLELRGGAKTEQGFFFQDSVTALQNHLVNQPFHRDEARIAASKVACVAAWIQRHPAGVTIEQLRFQSDRIAELRGLQIQAPWTPLTRLKGGNAQAFHYWYQAQRILTGGSMPEESAK